MRLRACEYSSRSPDSLVGIWTLWRRNESHADTVFLDPRNPAFPDRGVVRHDKAKAGGHEGRVLQFYRGTLGRDVAHHATHHETARRDIGRLVDFGSRVFSLFFH